MIGILGKKLGMSQLITEEGHMVPVTYLVCEPNTVHQKKTEDKDGYSAVVLGAGPLKKPTKTKKFKKLKEFKCDEGEYKEKDKIKVDIFEPSDLVRICGVSKGKGFQGRVRRHNARVSRRTHGTKYTRHGSTGQCAMPGRTKKGTKMPGRMGCDTVTLRNRPIMMVDVKRNILAIKGSVPGAINSLVVIEKQ